MTTYTWAPASGICVRLTEVEPGTFSVEIWQKMDEGDSWSYLCLKPPELVDLTLDFILQEGTQ